MTASFTNFYFPTNPEYKGFGILCFFQHKISRLFPQIMSHPFHGMSMVVDLARQHCSIPHEHVLFLPWNAESVDASGTVWRYVAKNRNKDSGGWFVKEFNKGRPENLGDMNTQINSHGFQFVTGMNTAQQYYTILQCNTEYMDTPGRIWKYILAYSSKPKESCLHELVAKSSLSAVLRFLPSSHKQKCVVEKDTNPPEKWVKLEMNELVDHRLIKPYIPIKPNRSFHQLNHDQLKIVLIFTRKMLQLMTMKDLSAVIPLHCTILGAGGTGDTILINTLTSIFRHILNHTNAIPLIAFDNLHNIERYVYLSSSGLNWAGKTIHKMSGDIHHLPVILRRDIYQLPPVQRMVYVYLSRNHLYWTEPTFHKMQGLSPKIVRLRRAHAYLRRHYRDDHHATSSIMPLNGDNSYTLTKRLPGYRPQHRHSKRLYHLRQSCNLILQDDRRRLVLSPPTREDISGYLSRYISLYDED
jgi:hypothetical protein